MLHMVIMTHTPDTCAALRPDLGEKARNAFRQMEEVSKKHQVTVKGWWGAPPGHIFYAVADAPNAHAVNSFVIELQISHWNSVQVFPIAPIEENILWKQAHGQAE